MPVGKHTEIPQVLLPLCFDRGLKITHSRRKSSDFSGTVRTTGNSVPEAKENLLAKALLIIATCMRSFTYCSAACGLSLLMLASTTGLLRNARG